MTDLPAHVAPAGQVELLACELPGCTNVMEYGGVGRKPKYCGQVVDGSRTPG